MTYGLPRLPLLGRTWPAAAIPFGTQQPDTHAWSASQSAVVPQHSWSASQHDPFWNWTVGGQHLGTLGSQKPPPSAEVQQVSSALTQRPRGLREVAGQHFGSVEGQNSPP